MRRIAEFYKSNSKAFRRAYIVISVLNDGKRTELYSVLVLNKREARAVAAQNDAKPWNF